MAVFQDSAGGFFSVWQPGQHPGSGVVNEPGAFSWNELNSRDVDGSIAFYESVFGWTHETHTMDGPIGSYTEWKLGGDTIGGMLPMPPMVPAEVPQFWLVYFAVADLDASLATLQELGGSVLMPGMTVDILMSATVNVPADLSVTAPDLTDPSYMLDPASALNLAWVGADASQTVLVFVQTTQSEIAPVTSTVARPMDAVTGMRRSSVWNGRSAKAARICSAISRASSALRPGKRTTNSSPP